MQRSSNNTCKSPAPFTPFSELPEEKQIQIFTEATNFQKLSVSGSLLELSKIALVCTRWSELQQDNALWRPIFKHCTAQTTYNIDFSQCALEADKVKLLMKSLIAFKAMFGECQRMAKMGPNSFFKNAPYRGYGDYLSDMPIHKVQMTTLLKTLVLGNHFEMFSKILQFRPSFDANQIADQLYLGIERGDPKHVLCFQMMIKLKYSLREFFQNIKTPDGYIKEMIRPLFFPKMNGLELSDYQRAFEIDTETSESDSVLKEVLEEYKLSK